MVVYRVENEKHEGPYSNDSKVTPRDWRDNPGDRDLDFRHPPPDMDGYRGSYIPSRMRFGAFHNGFPIQSLRGFLDSDSES